MKRLSDAAYCRENCEPGWSDKGRAYCRKHTPCREFSDRNVHQTHHANCYKYHHECAIALVERLRSLCSEAAKWMVHTGPSTEKIRHRLRVAAGEE